MIYSRSDIVPIVISLAFVAAGVVILPEPHKNAAVWFFGVCAMVLLAEPWIRRKRTQRAKGCAGSNGAAGFTDLLQKIQQLPGFDNEAVVKAMGSATNDRFIVWGAAR